METDISKCGHPIEMRYTGQPDGPDGPSTGDPLVDVIRCMWCDKNAWRARSDDFESKYLELEEQLNRWT